MSGIGFGRGQSRPVTLEEMREHAANLRARAQRLRDGGWNRLRETPGPMTTGTARYRASGLARLNQRATASWESANIRADALDAAAAKWEARADARDPELIAKRQRQREAKAEAKVTADDFYRHELHVGRVVYVFGRHPATVTKVNRKSVRLEGRDDPYTFEEFTLFDDDQTMRTALRAFLDQHRKP